MKKAEKNAFDPYDNFAEYAFSQAQSRVIINHDVTSFDTRAFCVLLSNMLSIAIEEFYDLDKQKGETLYANMINMLINHALKDEYADMLLGLMLAGHNKREEEHGKDED